MLLDIDFDCSHFRDNRCAGRISKIKTSVVGVIKMGNTVPIVGLKPHL